MSQIVGRASAPDTKALDNPAAIERPKVVRGGLENLFNPLPTDGTTVSGKYETFGQKNNGVMPLEIEVPRTVDWVDMSKTILEFDVEFHDAAGAVLGDDTRVAPVNLIGQSLIAQFELLINKGSTGETAENYHYKAYFDRLMNHSKESKDNYLTMEGWYTDEPGKFTHCYPFEIDTPVVAAAAAGGGVFTPAEIRTALQASRAQAQPNKGLIERKKLMLAARNAANPGRIKFMISPIIDVFQSDKLLVPGSELLFRIRWNRPEVVLMTDNRAVQANAAGGGNPPNGIAAGANNLGPEVPAPVVAANVHVAPVAAPNFTIINGTPRLHIFNVKLDPTLHNSLENQMLNNKMIASYDHMSTRIVSQVIPDGRARESFKNVFNGSKPNYMIIGFLPNNAFTGNYQLNPYNFTRMNLNTIRVTVNGNEVPYERQELDIAENLRAYMTVPNLSGKFMDAPSIGIGRDDYAQGNFLLCYNFNPDGHVNQGYNYANNVGNVNIDLDFNPVTANDTTVVVYGEFENALWIDGSKNTTLKYNY